jgi:nucleotide-binding universal stress UspA family protein
VEWAAAEARRRRLPLRIVHAFVADWTESRYDIGNEHIDVPRVLAEAVLADAHARARDVAPDIGIETGALLGHPVPRLLEASRGADLLVVGSRPRGDLTGVLRGSTGRRLATDAFCPVVVVRGRPATGGPVVAGVGDSPTADLVLRTAFEMAAGHDTSLVVVRSYRPVVPYWLADMRPTHRAAEDAGERARLAEQLEPWLDKFPDVAVDQVLTCEGAAAALVAAAHWARLIVVGPPRHRVAAIDRPGSTCSRLLHHAQCPILVAGPEPAREI